MQFSLVAMLSELCLTISFDLIIARSAVLGGGEEDPNI